MMDRGRDRDGAALVIRNAVVLPIVPAGTVFDPGWVRVVGDRVDSLGAGEPALQPGDEVIDARGDLVLPGFVSTHQHLLDVLLRGGVARGPDFLDWLLGLYYGGMTAMTPADAGLATLLAGSETLLAGVTTVVDNWGIDSGGGQARYRRAAEASLESYRRLGLRVIFARMFATRLPPGWETHPLPYDPKLLVAPLDETLASIKQLMNDFDGSENGRIRVTASPELIEMVDAEGALAALDLARGKGLKLPIHLLTSEAGRVANPAEWMHDIGLLSSDLLAAHCTAATRSDLALLADRRVSVAHCPTSNAFGGQAVAVTRFLDAGLTVGLGSDNATLNCNSDILAEARRAALAAKVEAARDRAARVEAAAVEAAQGEAAEASGSPDLSARLFIELATIGGADAIGAAREIGSLEPGKKADLIVLDTSGPHWWPRHDWYETLLFQGRSADVHTVVIDGRIVVRDRRLTGLEGDQRDLLGPAAQRASRDLLARGGLSAKR